ncbi:MAG: hypothetical protein IPI75_02775 [Gammaproteobacteria bacterium]|nr:hypothetical protein [Gammaproteobacteria bacterium]
MLFVALELLIMRPGAQQRPKDQAHQLTVQRIEIAGEAAVGILYQNREVGAPAPSEFRLWSFLESSE